MTQSEKHSTISLLGMIAKLALPYRIDKYSVKNFFTYQGTSLWVIRHNVRKAKVSIIKEEIENLGYKVTDQYVSPGGSYYIYYGNKYIIRISDHGPNPPSAWYPVPDIHADIDDVIKTVNQIKTFKKLPN